MRIHQLVDAAPRQGRLTSRGLLGAHATSQGPVSGRDNGTDERLAVTASDFLACDDAAPPRSCCLGICLSVDIAGRLLRANAAARDLLRRGAVLRVDAGRIAATTSAATALLRSAIRQVAGEGGSAVPLVLPEAGAGDYPVLVAPPRAAACAGEALVLSLDPSYRRGGPGSGFLALWFGLTPAEAEVALRAARGDGLRAIADALGIQHSTARSHLHRVFQKAGVSRQAELAWMVAHLPR